MERQLLGSSDLKSVGYDNVSRMLEIEFTDGAVKRYFGVPTHVYQDLLESPTFNTFFREHVEDRFRDRAA